MDKKKQKKFKNLLYIIVLISVFIMFIGMYTAYYLKHNKKDNIIENNVLMSLTFDGKNEINVSKIKPGWEDEILFSVSNDSKDTIGKYKIILEIITPFSNMIEENLVYTINGQSNNKDKSNILVYTDETVVPVASKTYSDCVITPNTKHDYKLKLNFKKTKDNKKYSSDNMLVLRIKMVSDDN